MTKLSLGFAGVLFSLGCAQVIPDYLARKRLGFDNTPSVWVHLSIADQVCAEKSGFKEVFVWVDLINLEPQGVRMIINDSEEQIFFGAHLTWHLHKVGTGFHVLKVWVGTRYQEKLFSVWNCQEPNLAEAYVSP